MAYADMAVTLYESYGAYPVANTFAANDAVPDLPDSELPAYAAAFDADPSAKRHAACDECSICPESSAQSLPYLQFLRKAQAEMFWRAHWL